MRCRGCRLLAEPRPAPVSPFPHRSGINEASGADRITEALALVDIKFLDHIIVAGGETMSFAERGMI